MTRMSQGVFRCDSVLTSAQDKNYTTISGDIQIGRQPGEVPGDDVSPSAVFWKAETFWIVRSEQGNAGLSITRVIILILLWSGIHFA